MVGVTSCDQFYGPQDTEKPRPNPGWIHHGVPASEARRWHLANRSRRHPTATRGTSLPSQTTGVAMGNEVMRIFPSGVFGSRDHPRTQIQITCTHRARLKPLRSPAHAAEDHMYKPASPRSHVHTSEIICARRFRSRVHTSTLRPRSHVHTTTLTL